MTFGRHSGQAIIAAIICIATVLVLAHAPALAGSKSDDAMRRMQERAQEQARQQQEREQARQAREQARQQAQQEREQAREQARQEREQAKSDREQGKSAAASAKEPATAVEQAKAADASKAAATDDKTLSPAEKARIERDKTRRDMIEDDKVPSTVAEWFSGLIKPSVPVAPVAVPAPTTTSVRTPPPAVGQPSAPTNSPSTATKSAAGKPVVVTGSTPAPVQPTVATKTPVQATVTTTTKVAPKVTPIRPDSGLPSFPPQSPEVLARNLTAKNIEQAVALGFKVNGVSGVSRLDLSLTRLIAPDGFSAERARELLSQSLPGTAVGVNQAYRIYRTATGALPASLSDQSRPARSMPTSCGTDRCFGASIIKWQASLQECSRGTKVGVIDTGYDASHPTFRARVIEARTSVASDRARSPDWHGTGVMALLAGDGLSGTPGLIPDAKFYLADIFYAGADGLPSSDTASLIDALEWLDKRRVSVVNMSLSGPPDDLLQQVIEGLSAKGIIFVAAAGNDGPSAPPSYPAAYSSVIAVTAVGRDLKSYRYANRGDHIDVAAPGVDIWTALPGGQGSYHSGTSFAVPYVTAVLATAYKGLAVKNKAEFFKRATVVDLGEPGRDPIYGRGLLQAPVSCAASVPVASIKTPLATPVGLIGQALPSR